jgi:hypothetical protein
MQRILNVPRFHCVPGEIPSVSCPDLRTRASFLQAVPSYSWKPLLSSSPLPKVSPPRVQLRKRIKWAKLDAVCPQPDLQSSACALRCHLLASP